MRKKAARPKNGRALRKQRQNLKLLHHFNMVVRVNVTWLVTPAGAPLYK
jgi:hypothetical protein